MGASQRNKGARGERELAKLLEDYLGVAVTRNLMQTRDGGHDLNGLPVALEVKRQETLRLQEWWFQAVTQATRVAKLPALAWRQNGKQWTFRVPLRLMNPAWPVNLTADVNIEAFCFAIRENIPDAVSKVRYGTDS